MRTTVTLDPDTTAIVKRLMKERGMGFKEALNEAIRAGAVPAGGRQRLRMKTFDMGTPRVPLDKALRLAGELEDEELLRKRALRK